MGLVLCDFVALLCIVSFCSYLDGCAPGLQVCLATQPCCFHCLLLSCHLLPSCRFTLAHPSTTTTTIPCPTPSPCTPTTGGLAHAFASNHGCRLKGTTCTAEGWFEHGNCHSGTCQKIGHTNVVALPRHTSTMASTATVSGSCYMTTLFVATLPH